MKIIVFLFMFLAHHIVYGATCFVDEEARLERSNAYLNEVKFTSDIDGSEIDVMLIFPLQIEGRRLSRIILVKASDTDEGAHFMFPLEAKLEGEGVQAWYMLSKEMIGNNIIQAAYGDSCGLLVQYQLDYKEQKLKPQ